MSNKRFGLILPDKGKKAPVFQASRNVFGNDSDSEDDHKKKPVLLRPSDNIIRQSKVVQEKAINEDPTVYQYDEIYENMSKEKDKVKIKEEKKPQYIENLLKAANKRKIENERRVERQIQKEREKEGDEFKDKEVFVTSAYKKKLEEMKIEEENEKREEYLESIGDVTKQKDLGGFYRHLYEQKLGKEKRLEDDSKDVKIEKETDSKIPPSNPVSEKTDVSKIRNYRKRKSSDSQQHLSDGEIEDSDDEINRVNLEDIRLAKKAKLPENIDADSDFSIDESSDEEDHKKGKQEVKQLVIEKKEKENDNIESGADKSNIKNLNTSTDKKEEAIEPKVKIDIWKKRTVGPVFEEALKRYYERKAARGL